MRFHSLRRHSLGVLLGTMVLTACEREAPRVPADTGGAVPQMTPAPVVATPLQLAPGTFGFANAEGSLLLAMEAIALPAAIHSTVCPGAPARAVAAAGHQPHGTHDTGRQTAANFREQSGDRFRVTGAPVPIDVSCFLTADSALVAGLLPLETPPEPPRPSMRRPAAPVALCDSAWTAPVATARGRAIAQCWPMGQVPGGPVLFAVRFVTRDTNALASLVALDGPTRWYHDFPAVDHGKGQAVWRLDDGGTFPAAAMRIRFVSRVRGVLVVGMTWDGAEGENAYLLAADSSGAFRTLQHTYRYTAPM